MAEAMEGTQKKQRLNYPKHGSTGQLPKKQEKRLVNLKRVTKLRKKQKRKLAMHKKESQGFMPVAKTM